jgi:hypothetical protein
LGHRIKIRVYDISRTAERVARYLGDTTDERIWVARPAPEFAIYVHGGISDSDQNECAMGKAESPWATAAGSSAEAGNPAVKRPEYGYDAAAEHASQPAAGDRIPNLGRHRWSRPWALKPPSLNTRRGE